jgi:hypothetical protein
MIPAGRLRPILARENLQKAYNRPSDSDRRNGKDAAFRCRIPVFRDRPRKNLYVFCMFFCAETGRKQLKGKTKVEREGSGKPAKTLEKTLFLGFSDGAPGRIRTYDRRIRNPMLYPTELLGPDPFVVADHSPGPTAGKTEPDGYSRTYFTNASRKLRMLPKRRPTCLFEHAARTGDPRHP